MGGSGSGPTCHWWRGRKKDVVEGRIVIDANRWMRDQILRFGIHIKGEWVWSRVVQHTNIECTIRFEINTLGSPPWLGLDYKLTQDYERLTYRVELASTAPYFGGLRWWFLCPLIIDGRPCGRRVGKLYLCGRHFGCRHCHKLTYTSCQESRRFESLYRFVAGDIRCDIKEVKKAMSRLGNRKKTSDDLKDDF